MTPTLSLAGAQIGIRHCVCLDSCNRASSSAHYLVRRSQQRRRHCASLALRLAFHTAIASKVAVVLHHQHTTWCGAHNDAVNESRWRSDWHSHTVCHRSLCKMGIVWGPFLLQGGEFELLRQPLRTAMTAAAGLCRRCGLAG